MKILRTKPVIYVMIGPSGSGKSTWIKENLGPEFPITSRDKIREELGIIGSDGKKKNGTKEQEEKVTKIQEEQIQNFLKKRESFAIDNMNLNPEKLVEDLRKYNVWIIGVKINTSLETIIKRRPEIPKQILEDMWKRSNQRVNRSLFNEFIEYDNS